MMNAKILRSMVFMVIFCSAFVCVNSAGAEQITSDEKERILTKEDRIFGLVTIYRTAKQHFALFEQVPELNWDQSFKEFLPLVEKEQNLQQYYNTLRRFTALLEDGHTQVYLPEALTRKMGDLPLRLDYIEDNWVVLERHCTEEIMKEDVPQGSVILSIEGVPTTEYIEKNIFPLIGSGSTHGKRAMLNWGDFFTKNTPVHLKLRYPDGSDHSRILHAGEPLVWNWDRMEKYLWPWNHPISHFSTRTLDENILYVRYGICSKETEDKFAELIKSMESPHPKAMILDLRGNIGGSTPIKTVRHLISKPAEMFFFKTPCSISYLDARMEYTSKGGQTREEIAHELLPNFPEYTPGWFSTSSSTIEPLESHYDGPLVILTNSRTASAGEDLAVLLHGNKRGVVIGEPTFGSTGQPIHFDLPGGGRVRICTCLALYPDGKTFVGTGVQPDVPVKRTIKGIAEGRDEVLDAALEFVLSHK